MPKYSHTANSAELDSLQDETIALLDRLQGHLQDLFYRTDAQGKIIWCTKAITPLLGYELDELVGVKLSTLYEDPSERDRFLTLLQKQGGNVINYRARMRHKDGSTVWVSTNAHFVYSEDGAVQGVEGTVRNITQQQQTEQALRESELLFRTLAETSGSIIFVYSEKFLYVNPELEKFLGYTADELLTMSILEVVHPEFQDMAKERASARLRGEKVPTRYDIKVVTNGGQDRWLDLSAGLIQYRGKNAVIATGFDITDRKNAENALQESETNLRALAENANDGMLVILDGKHVFANRSIANMLGYELDELYGTSIKDIVHPDEYEKVVNRHRRRMAGEDVPKQYETLFITKTGEPIQIEIAGAQTTWRGKPAGLILVRDISERRRKESLLIRFGRILEDSINEIYIFDAEDLHFIQANQGAQNNLGYSMDELKQLTPIDVKPEYSKEQFTKLIEPLKAKEVGQLLFETIHQRKDGTTYPVEIRLQLSTQETPPVFVAVIQDITERKQAEDALRISEERFRQVFQSNSAIITINRLEDGHYIDVNESFVQKSGYTREEVIGHTSLELRIWDNPEDRNKMVQELKKTGSIHDFEFAFRNKSGELLVLLASVERVDIAGGTCILFFGQDISDRKIAESALRDSESRYRTLVDHASEAIFIVQDNHLKFPNPKTLEITGYSLEELARIKMDNLVAPEDRALIVQRHHNRLTGKQEPNNYQFRILTKQGKVVWVTISTTMVPWEGRPATLNVMRDITQSKQHEEILFREKERAQVTLQSIGDGVITTDATGHIESLNLVAEQFTGWRLNKAKGLELSKVFNIIDETTRIPAQNPVSEPLASGTKTTTPGHTALIRTDGKELSIEFSASPIKKQDGGIIGAVLVFRDVTEMRGLARQLSFQASHDSLTGLINRREFEARLDYALESTKTEDKTHALCYLDLDQFKVVNDTCGHIAGDELLKQLATLLQSKVRGVDTLARLGGDEFGILLEGCPLAKAQQIANTLRSTVKEFRFVWQDKSFEVGCSIGLVTITAQTDTISDLLIAADAACYMAKDLGRNRVYSYKPDDKELARRHGEMQWVTRLNTALKSDHFELYYQTIIAVSKDEHIGEGERGEILLRLRDKHGQHIPPMAFIPAAERYGLMPAIDRWVIEKVFTLFDGTPLKSRNKIGCLAINLSGQSLSDETFLQFVLDKLDASTIKSHQLCFEITETAAISNLQGAMKLIDCLRERGCRFALDDFGSGLSSFAYLKNLHVDFLKIDGHFVRDIADDPIDLAMVESINHIGHVMGIKTVAEFVESESVINKLKELGVDYAQGYHIAKPKPLSEVLLALLSE